MIEEARCRLDCGVTLELAPDSGKLWKGKAISIGIRPENTRIGEGNGTDATFSGVSISSSIYARCRSFNWTCPAPPKNS